MYNNYTNFIALPVRNMNQQTQTPHLNNLTLTKKTHTHAQSVHGVSLF